MIVYCLASAPVTWLFEPNGSAMQWDGARSPQVAQGTRFDALWDR
jgi:hypothetical protein